MLNFSEFLTESGGATAVSGHANEHFTTELVNNYVDERDQHISNGHDFNTAHNKALETLNNSEYNSSEWENHPRLQKARKMFDDEEMSNMHHDSKITANSIINHLHDKHGMIITKSHHMGLDGPAGAEKLTGKRSEADLIIEGKGKNKGENKKAAAFTEFLGASLKYSKGKSSALKIFSPGITTFSSYIDDHEKQMGVRTNRSISDELEEIKNEGIQDQRRALAPHHDTLQEYFSDYDAKKQAKSKRTVAPSYIPEYDGNGNVVGAQLSQAAVSHIRDSKNAALRDAYDAMASGNLRMKTRLSEAIHSRIKNILDYEHSDPGHGKKVKESLFRTLTNLDSNKLPTYLISTTRNKGSEIYDMTGYMDNILKTSGVPNTSRNEGASTFKMGDFSAGIDTRPTTGGTSGDANPLSGPINITASTAQIKKAKEQQETKRTEDEKGSNQHGPIGFSKPDDPSSLSNRLGAQQ